MTNVGHTHLPAEIADAGAFATVDWGDLVSAELDGGPIGLPDEVPSRAARRDYVEVGETPPASAGTLTLDLRGGSLFEVVLTEDVASLTSANRRAPGRAQSITPILKQDATGDPSFAWPAETRWANGRPPAIPSAAQATDVYALVARGGGTTCYGFAGAKGLS